ncbi:MULTISPECIES: GtrA family protein [unclassified Pseudomonas]|uniref:GtrA family protein n=1 Tax=unclassified Pseudomonas TaxID=196821 RepID=UPI000BA3F45A|nr:MULTISPECIES: GtrA family protein [unclassified Pseudomonas]
MLRTPAFRGFSRFASIGLLNTLIHWTVFFVLYGLLGLRQAPSNLAAFCLAVTFSFYANARYTFQRRATLPRYLLFVTFMGALSFGVGYGADHWRLPGLLTLMVFSAISLVCGFLFSRFLVFREPEA